MKHITTTFFFLFLIGLPFKINHVTAQNLCNITNLVVEAYECDENGQFLVDVDFNYTGVSNEGFTAASNNINYGTFSYNELPITLGPFEGDGETPYEFLIADWDIFGCNEIFTLAPILCEEGGEDCALFDLNIETDPCTEGNTYNAYVNFEYEGIEGIGFDVWLGETLEGFYSYDDLPLVLDDVPNNESPYQTLTICENDNSDCCIATEYLQPCAESSGDCAINDLIVEVYECDEEGQFFVDLDFNYTGVGNDGFTVVGNGTNYGTFSYNDLFITLGPLDGDGETIYEFIVTDVNNPECTAFTGLEPIVCEGDVIDCAFFDLEIETDPCTEGNTYNAYVNFEYEGVEGIGFDVWLGETLEGFYSYDDLPLVLDDVPNNESPYQTLTICENDNPDCCIATEYLQPCDIPVGDCGVDDLSAVILPCQDDGTFGVRLNFFYVDASDSFRVQGNGTNYGFFAYTDLPIDIWGLAGNGELQHEFIIIDQFDDNCTTFTGIPPVACLLGGVDATIENLSFGISHWHSTKNNLQLNLTSQKPQHIDFQLYDLNGKLLINQTDLWLNLGENSLSITRKNVPEGIYLLQLKNQEEERQTHSICFFD
ncbi:MAG: T9SS type A sorting domain-containing protein [Chitinophagales bacterium]